MNNSIKWECGSFTLSTIKETPKKEWVELVMKTRSEKAKYLFTEEEMEGKLIKIWNDVNGIEENIEVVDADTEAAPVNSPKSRKKE